MASGIIKLGAPGDLREYAVEPQGDGINWSRGPANPYAVKVDTSSLYDKIDAWNEWVQEDWQAGVGRTDPEAGGFLYGEIDSRVPNQLILPPRLYQLDQRRETGLLADCRYMPQDIVGTVTVGSGGQHLYVAIKFTTPTSLNGAATPYHFFGRIPEGVSVAVSVYTDSAGSPGSLVVQGNPIPGGGSDLNYRWYTALLSNTGLSPNTTYWLRLACVQAGKSFEVAYSVFGYAAVSKSYDGNTWSDMMWSGSIGMYLVYSTGHYRLLGSSGSTHFIRFNGELYATGKESNGTASLFKYSSAERRFTKVGTLQGTGDVASLAVFGPTLYIGRTSGNYSTLNTSETIGSGSVEGELFLEFGGYLYRSVGRNLYYTADGSNWFGPFPMGSSDVKIRGMAGLADSVYVATDKALLRLAPGDIVEEVTRFGTEDSTNGRGMIEYQGRLYIPAEGRLLRFDTSGQLVDVWVSRDDDMPSGQIGSILSLTRMNNWLVAHVLPPGAGKWSSLWMYQEEGWHFIASGMQREYSGLTPSTVYYDRGTKRLWIGQNFSGPYYIEVDDYALNPYNVEGYDYAPVGWLEQDRFYGGQYLLRKNFESVTIIGDNLTFVTPVEVYWQEQGDTEWRLLGTAVRDGQELRWDDPATRPVGNWIRLAVRLITTSGTRTPRVRAIVVKFLPMVNDRIRDTMTLTLSDYVQMADGKPSQYTLDEQFAHLSGPDVIGAEGTVHYVDPFGQQYEVTVVDHQESITRIAYYDGSLRVKEMRVVLVVEQVANVTNP